MTKEHIKEFLDFLAGKCPEAVLIGKQGEDRERFIPAVVGFDNNNGRVIYSRDKLIDCYVESDGMTREEAIEWIEYNVDRALPYMGSNAPIIMDDMDIIMGW